MQHFERYIVQAAPQFQSFQVRFDKICTNQYSALSLKTNVSTAAVRSVVLNDEDEEVDHTHAKPERGRIQLESGVVIPQCILDLLEAKNDAKKKKASKNQTPAK
mmetsp:Transcript_4422/g.7395  ORF Transcript_4422/g.7395 Transcript_4422/m.7395 type:complete len:104 (-) Transcript_4422:49-360(-)